jgi:hypothetical protein
VIKATLVNGYLYAPWLVKPFPFLDGPNLDLNQSGAVSDSLARTKPDYYENTTPDPNGHVYAPIKKRIRAKATSVEGVLESRQDGVRD